MEEYDALMFHVLLEEAKDGWLVAECPALPGYSSQELPEEKAFKNVR